MSVLKKNLDKKHKNFDFLGGSEKHFKKSEISKIEKSKNQFPQPQFSGNYFFYSLNSHSSQVEMAIHLSTRGARRRKRRLVQIRPHSSVDRSSPRVVAKGGHELYYPEANLFAPRIATPT